MARRPITYRVTEQGCFECSSHHRNSHGYPYMRVDGKLSTVVRHLWEDRHGPIPDGMVLRHRCDNRACINLDHVLLGTHADNVRDRVARERSHRKLGVADILAIRRSDDRIVDLALWLGVSRRTISKIRNASANDALV